MKHHTTVDNPDRFLSHHLFKMVCLASDQFYESNCKLPCHLPEASVGWSLPTSAHDLLGEVGKIQYKLLVQNFRELCSQLDIKPAPVVMFEQRSDLDWRVSIQHCGCPTSSHEGMPMI